LVLTLHLKISQLNTIHGVLLILMQPVLGMNLTTNYVHEFLSRLQMINFSLNLLFTEHQSNYRNAACFSCVSRKNKLYSGQLLLWWKRGNFFHHNCILNTNSQTPENSLGCTDAIYQQTREMCSKATSSWKCTCQLSAKTSINLFHKMWLMQTIESSKDRELQNNNNNNNNNNKYTLFDSISLSM